MEVKEEEKGSSKISSSFRFDAPATVVVEVVEERGEESGEDIGGKKVITKSMNPCDYSNQLHEFIIEELILVVWEILIGEIDEEDDDEDGFRC